MNWTDVNKLMEAIEVKEIEDQERLKKGLLQREMFLRLADAPAPYRYYEVNYDGLVYVAQQVMADRNNLVFDWWNIEVLDEGVCTETWTAWAMVKMTASLLGQTRSITQRGVNKVTILQGKDTPTGDDKEQAIKSAISDGMKKCSSWFGVFSHVFRGDVFAVLPHRDKKGNATSEQYLKLLNHFKLREKEYRYGIPILPNEFKNFYQKMGWKDGIFQDDFLNVCYRNREQCENQKSSQPVDRNIEKEAETRPTISKHQVDYIRKMALRINSEASDEEIMKTISRHLKEVHGIDLPARTRLETIPKEHGQIVIDFFRERIRRAS